MRRPNDQRGSALVMVVGLSAALAILVVSLVTLTANVQSNTARDRTETKAFNVAEAALDTGLSMLGHGWPEPGDPAMIFSADDAAAFRAQFPVGEFPSPATGAFVDIIFYDDNDFDGDGLPDAPLDKTVHYDADDNGRMYIEAQAAVGDRQSRIMALAERVFFDTNLPRGVAVATDGDIDANNHKLPVMVHYAAPDQPTIVAKAGGTIAADACQPSVTPQPGQTLPLVDSLLAPEVVSGLIDIAKMTDKFYPRPGGPSLPQTHEDWEGLVVIQTTAEIHIPQDFVPYNGDGVGDNKPPGMLLVVGPQATDPTSSVTSGGFQFIGNSQYYGVLYTDGDYAGVGTSDVYGMVLAYGTVDLKGDRTVRYDDRVIMNIDRMILLNAKIVDDTWREISPE
jgi:hypothetical protein